MKRNTESESSVKNHKRDRNRLSDTVAMVFAENATSKNSKNASGVSERHGISIQRTESLTCTV